MTIQLLDLQPLADSIGWAALYLSIASVICMAIYKSNDT